MTDAAWTDLYNDSAWSTLHEIATGPTRAVEEMLDSIQAAHERQVEALQAEVEQLRERNRFREATTSMPAEENPPLWHAREGLDVRDLANALEHIRRSAYMHWFGDAFDPEHMHAISALAAQALCGEPIDSPVDMNSPEWRDRVRERSQEWMDLCDDAVVEQAGYLDRGEPWPAD